MEYEPRLKINVPYFEPKYIETGIKCFIEKMKTERKIGYICPNMRPLGSSKCKLWWLCNELAEVTLTSHDIIKDRWMKDEASDY